MNVVRSASAASLIELTVRLVVLAMKYYSRRVVVPKVTNRTDDLSLTRGLLYRLSYKGEEEEEDWLLVTYGTRTHISALEGRCPTIRRRADCQYTVLREVLL